VPYKDADTQGIFDACTAIVNLLLEAGIRAESDARHNYSLGWKYSQWEMKGVPLRIEIGPKDLANKQVRAAHRDSGAKIDIGNDDLVEEIKKLLDNIQHNLFDVAKQKRDACIQIIHTWYQSLSNSRATYLFTHQAQRVLGVRGCIGKNPSPTSDR